MAVALPRIKRPVHRPYPGLACPRCGTVLSQKQLRNGENVCGACRRPFLAEVFDLPEEFSFARSLGQSVDAEAPCAVHAGNAAVSPCARCGNFMCGLCETDFCGTKYCPACFERVAEEGDERTVKQRSLNFQAIAALCAACMVAGPAVIVCSIYSLKQIRREQLRDGRISSAVLMLLVGILESVWIVVGLIVIILQVMGKKL